MEPKIIFEDDCLLVVDKPAGMVVNRAKTVKGKTLQDWLEKNFQFSIFNFQKCRSGIVHRLDKETSGLLLIAKTQKAFDNLQKQFKQRRVKKKYLALAHGKLASQKGEIVLPIGRMKKDREKFGIEVEGRKARTKYKMLKYYDALSLVELMPSTGRTHQLRVHLSFLGHPIVSDLKYGGKRAKKDRSWCPRLFLHAAYLGFYHPGDGRFCEFTTSLPSKLKNVILKTCGKNSSSLSFF